LIVRRRAAFAALACAIWGVTLLTATRRPVDRSDEEWFVWVARRLELGTPLYRGVYYVTTPVAIWVMRAVGLVFGSSLTAERALEAACFTCSLLLGWAICTRCRVGRVGRVALAALLVVYASPVAAFGSVYSALAVTASLAVLLCLLDWLAAPVVDARRPSSRLLLAGILSGVAFASKPSTGLLALVAALTVLAAAHWPRVRTRAAWADACVLSVGFLMVNALVVLPILLAGSFDAFVSDVFSGKSNYLAVMSGLLPGRDHALDLVTGRGAPLGQLLVQTNVFVPIAGIVATGWAVCTAGRTERLRVVALVAFGLVGLGAAYPRLGPQHLTEAMPLLLVVPFAACGLARAARSASDVQYGERRFAPAVSVLVALVSVAAVSVVVWPPGSGRADGAAVQHDIAALRTATHGTVFIVDPEAAYYYVKGHLKDPTPFDYPSLSDFGDEGEPGVIAMLRHHRAQWVCVPKLPVSGATPGRANPVHLEQFVRRSFVLTARLHACDLYRDPGPQPLGS
jgi:hypothetical protein